MLGIINFAHGDVLMVGAMVALSAIGVMQNHFPGLAVRRQLVIALIVARHRLRAGRLHRSNAWPTGRLRNAPRLAPLITAIGVSILLQTLRHDDLGPQPAAVPATAAVRPDQRDHGTAVAGAVISHDRRCCCIVVAVAVMVGLRAPRRKDQAGPRDARHRREPARRRPDGREPELRDRRRRS